MAKPSVKRYINEQRYFDALQKIARQYMTTGQLQRNAEKRYGLSYHEALEMSYDNIQAEALEAIRGRRRPKAFGAEEKGASSDRTSPTIPAPKTIPEPG